MATLLQTQEWGGEGGSWNWRGIGQINREQLELAWFDWQEGQIEGGGDCEVLEKAKAEKDWGKAQHQTKQWPKNYWGKHWRWKKHLIGTLWLKKVQTEGREGNTRGKVAEFTLSDSLLIDLSLQCLSETTSWSQRQSGTQAAAWLTHRGMVSVLLLINLCLGLYMLCHNV